VVRSDLGVVPVCAGGCLTLAGIAAQQGPKRATGRRGRPPSLTHAQIAAAALKVSSAPDARGEISMRALARELGVPVMTIYNYVPNKDALYALVLNHILRPVRVPDPEEGSWEDRMRQLQRAARAALAEHGAVTSFRRGGTATEAMRLTEGALSILSSGGLDPEEAALAFASLFTFMLGQIEVDAMTSAADRDSVVALEAGTRTTRLSRDELFEFGFDVVMEGLKVKLQRKRTSGRRARQRSN
jgi:AcrR family transcriptional regulator